MATGAARTIKCHYDGRVFVPDEPVDLPVGGAAIVHPVPVGGTGGPRPEAPPVPDDFGDDEAGARRLTYHESGVVFSNPPPGKPATVGDVSQSAFIGGWAHRTDVTDGREFVDRLAAERRARRHARWDEGARLGDRPDRAGADASE